MTVVLGAIVGLFLVALIFGGLTGRVRLTSCCSVADPAKDLRMRPAFQEQTGTLGPDQVSGAEHSRE